MPHLTLEYTDNLLHFNADKVLLTLNRKLANSSEFEEIDIKSRAIKIASFRVGISHQVRGFVHVKLAILSGRSNETKRVLSESILLVLKQLCKLHSNLHVQLCVEIQEIERDSYIKASIGT
ncbi:5-carboxymethyl-2-hydroxymuconate Delta-isomerase [Undibacterium jejuense]|uniref:5-carboxymethyl-2-hydroxymuconate Delta-isomerase n=1 Tax=Undibacterium jejuense TaxID=1344949 RepID=A0A923HGM6_9BURK|nr:5-carboxymethyl-2-hydroxymuconate Delta-isomerase [Undibacterium jejuense]MBC3862660.1 5-carboxymethyl-2-hydroxymuconate Delta-isomerase [Undibacterium jejuense]